MTALQTATCRQCCTATNYSGEASCSFEMKVPMSVCRIQLQVDFTNLSLRLKSTGKKVLAGVTGSLRAACLTAIMGPSGAGVRTHLGLLLWEGLHRVDLTGFDWLCPAISS